MESSNEQLELIGEVNRLSRQLKRETYLTQRRLNKTTVQKYKRELEYKDDEVPAIGDVVRIVNPKPGQQDQGVVHGHCKDGKVKTRTKQGVIITRLPKNIQYTVYESRHVSG